MKSEFYIFIPSRPFNKWIQFIWISRGEHDTTKSIVLPNGAIELIINFGNKQKVLEKTTFKTQDTFKNYWIAGLQQQPIIIQSETDTNLLGIRFLPGGAYPFFKFPISEVSNSVVEVDWLKKELEELRNRINLSDHKNLICIIEEYLIKKIDGSYLTNETVKYIADKIFSYDSQITIKELIKKSGYSHKHFISLFREQVGTTPKTLQRIVRLQKIISAVKQKDNINWADIFYGFSYFDHAHFIHDFKELTWMTPEEYLSFRTFDENHCMIR